MLFLCVLIILTLHGFNSNLTMAPHHRILLTIFTVFVFFSNQIKAQSRKVGNWEIVTIVLPSNMDHRWGGYIEGQVRTDELLYNHAFYYEYKGGVSYAITKQAVALIGTGRYTTYDYRDLDLGPTIEENRVWEQFTYTQYLHRIKIEHRGRIEQRWLDDIYRNRFRYRLNAVLPVNHLKLQAKTFLISAFEEVFFNNRAPNFERNRIAASIGYQFDKSLTIQTGWLHQYNHTSSGDNAKHNMTVNITYQIAR
jgi:hypothetical protein